MEATPNVIHPPEMEWAVLSPLFLAFHLLNALLRHSANDMTWLPIESAFQFLHVKPAEMSSQMPAAAITDGVNLTQNCCNLCRLSCSHTESVMTGADKAQEHDDV
jgi:hypothetical protein